MADGGLLESLAVAAIGSAAGAGISALTAPHSHMALPPPPGASMLDPSGSAAASEQRKRQAIAGGLNSTITGAGTQGGSPAGATSGAKQTLG